MFFFPPEYIWLAEAFRDHLDSLLPPGERPERPLGPRHYANCHHVYEPIYDKAESAMLAALRSGKLIALVFEDRNRKSVIKGGTSAIVPKEAWSYQFAAANLHQGEDRTGRPIGLYRQEWEVWRETEGKVKRGRKPGSGSFAEQDKPLLNEMHRQILKSNGALSVPNAALNVAPDAAGAGSNENKAKRLERRYIATKNQR